MKIGIIREGKIPSDARVPFSPQQCNDIIKKFPIEIIVQPSECRCFTNKEYLECNIPVVENIMDCDILMGIKEVPTDQLIPHKTYCIFSHTIKAQPHNRKLLQAILAKKIRLIDYEALTDDHGRRLIAFGRFAGMVGAHNAIWTLGQRTGAFELPRMKDFFDYAGAKAHYQSLRLPPVRIVVTGSGRVGSGAVEVLRDMQIRQVSAEDFLSKTYAEAVFTHLSSHHYMKRKDGAPFDAIDFYNHPERYHNHFAPFAQKCDIFINGIYWNPQAPAFFNKEDMRHKDFNIKIIADVTCDLAPESSVPSTLKASTIADPVFGYDPFSESEVNPYQEKAIDMMTIDNLPSEMPRDASTYFGEQFIQHILPELLHPFQSSVLKRAIVAENGHLTPSFQYLQDYVDGLKG